MGCTARGRRRTRVTLAPATSSKKTSRSGGVWLYQLTGDGLAVELTAKGTRYYKDKDLN